MKKTSKMKNRKHENYMYRGTRGSGLVCNQKVVELGLSAGDQFMALADETMDDEGNPIIKTSKGFIPVGYFVSK